MSKLTLKESNALIAKKHTSFMTRYNEETNNSIMNTKIYRNDTIIIANKSQEINSEIIIEDLDTVSAAYKEAFKNKDSNIAILNFASYKNPGGGFIDGAMAQEESLCHVSNLYNILASFDCSYYSWNRKNLNKSLYFNRALYSPNVHFEKSEIVKYFNVVTCAAPNLGPGLKYDNVTLEENSKVLHSRIKFVLDIMSENDNDTIILGAFGCGIFKQDPSEVASIFKELIHEYSFKKVIFAIPGGKNLEAFRKVFE